MGFFDNLFGGGQKEADSNTPPPDSPEQIHMACAALLLEVAEADYADDPDEVKAILASLERELKLNHQEVEILLQRARSQTDGATDLFPYTHLLNQRLSREQKCSLLTAMWRVAYADGAVDKYEELLIRRASDLLRLDHPDFIAAKQAARPRED